MTKEEEAIEVYNGLISQKIKEAFEFFAPELKESEDKKIRKDLITFLDDIWHLGKNANFDKWSKADCSDWMAWLEKQCSIGNINEKLRQYREYLIKETERWWSKNEEDKTLSKIGKQDCIGHANAYISARSEFENLFNYDSWLEKQGEQKETPCDKCRREQPSHFCQDITELGRCILEHQSEQKTTDKIEPKFHAGDFITDGKRTFQIEETIWERNNRNDGSTYCESLIVNLKDGNVYANNTDLKEYHLWTIQDAKDGDVLYMDNGLSTCTFIYKSISNTIIQKYASYNKFGFEGRHYLVLNDGYVCPATKEQRDQLGKAITEAGYEWDAEKKELKKIEQNDIIEIPFGANDSELQEVTYYIPEGFHAEIEGNRVVIKKNKRKPTWSEVDYIN